jgi:hypothetical protein
VTSRSPLVHTGGALAGSGAPGSGLDYLVVAFGGPRQYVPKVISGQVELPRMVGVSAGADQPLRPAGSHKKPAIGRKACFGWVSEMISVADGTVIYMPASSPPQTSTTRVLIAGQAKISPEPAREFRKCLHRIPGSSGLRPATDAEGSAAQHDCALERIGQMVEDWLGARGWRVKVGAEWGRCSGRVGID